MRIIFLMVAALLLLAKPMNISAKDAKEPVPATQVREMADGLSGIRVNGNQVADKLVYLGHNAKGDLVVMGIAALTPGSDEGIEPVDGAVAILRTRAATSNNNMAPEAADFALAKSSGLAVYIIGEWSDPPKLWQIKPMDGGIMVREIDRAGAVSAWSNTGA